MIIEDQVTGRTILAMMMNLKTIMIKNIMMTMMMMMMTMGDQVTSRLTLESRSSSLIRIRDACPVHYR